MGWFDEQIRQRKLSDNQLFSDSFSNIANSVLGGRIKDDDSFDSKEAIEQVLKYFGYKVTFDVPNSVTEFEDQLEYICRPHGIMYRNVKLTEGWYKNASGVFVGRRTDTNEAIAIVPDGFSYKFVDDGKSTKITNHNASLIADDAICFYKPFPLKKLKIADLIKYSIFTRTKTDIAIILIFMGISTLIGLLIPELSYFMYSTLVESKSMSLLVSTITFFVCVQVSTLLFDSFKAMYNEKVSSKMNASVQAASMMRVLSLPANFFRKYSRGEISSRINCVSSLCDTLVSTIFNTGFTSLFSLVYIGSIFKFAPSLVVPALIIILITISFSVISSLIQINISKQRMEIGAKLSSLEYATISGIQKIRVSGAEKRAFSRWADLYAESSRLTYNPPAFVKWNGVISMAISTIGMIVMYTIALANGVRLAEYNAFSTAYGMVQGSFSSLASIVLTFANIRPTLDMAKPLLETEPEISEGKEIITDIRGLIELDDVSFRYDETMPFVIDKLSLKIEPGQYIAIVGKTGCGKSTLIRLLLGFEKPQFGAIYYDNRNINSIDMKSLRRKIGVVMQNGKVFQGDIFSNIVISAPELKLEDAWKAAEMAGIADDIRKMPMGMNTYLSEGSGGISGGQKQRLMIARAIASKPKVLIFDEATSALDNITQKIVSDSLDSLKCTRIVIAHRLSTIRHCDRILYLEDGKIKEDGTYDELIAKNGLFAELVERQRLDK